MRQTSLPGMGTEDDRAPTHEAPAGQAGESAADGSGGEGAKYLSDNPRPPHPAAAPPPVGRLRPAGRQPSPARGEGIQLGSESDAIDLRGKQVYVVDAHSLIFQVFHAIPEMTSPRGEPVNAVYGFTRDMLFLLEMKRPDYLFCAFDLPGPTFRHQLFPAYKEQRAEMPVDLIPQFPLIQQVLATLGIPVLSLPAFEADDILATLARLTEEAGGRCVLVSGDKDCRQLISDQVQVYNVRKDQLMDAAGLAADWGVRPDQVVDFQALVGDAVDNVPGIALIGPKLARELLEKYDTLDNLLSHAHEISGTKRKQNLLEGGEKARLSRELVRLDRHVPVQIDWPAGRTGRIDRAAALEMFRELGFRGFGDKVRGMPNADVRMPNIGGVARNAEDAKRGEVAEAACFGAEAGSFRHGDESPRQEERAAVPRNYRLIATAEDLAWLAEQLRRQPRFALDTETTHLWPTWADLVGISCAWQPGEAYYVPIRSPAGEPKLDEAAVLSALRPVLEDASIEKIGQNLKYDIIVFRRVGVEVRGTAFDTMIADYLLEAGERNHNIDELAQRYLGVTKIKTTDLIGAGSQQKRMDEVPVELICQYAAEDVDVPVQLAPILQPRLAERGLDGLFRDVEMPLVEVLVEIESNGVRIDSARLAQLSEQYGVRMQVIEQEIYQIAGREFNIASPKQLAKILFEEHKLPVVKKTKTGPSTDADVLEELALQHPLPAKIIEFRQYAKLKNTYVDALPTMVNPRTGRVHASFNQVVAATGRLSCGDPNLQNIPVRSDHGAEIRSAFLPGPEGWQLLCADYSQIELRVLAHFSGDETLCQAFARNDDIHSLVASQVHGVPLDQVTSAMRRQAKAVNFGVIYGQSAFGLARQLNIEKAAAQQFIDAYFARYPGVDAFLTKILAECEANGYVKTILGRRRAVRGVRLGAGRIRNLPERTAINTVIQGSAADLIKKSMIAIHRRLSHDRLSAKMLLQVHDELIFEVPPSELHHLARLVSEEMSGVMELAVPLAVDLSAGPNWADAQSFEL